MRYALPQPVTRHAALDDAHGVAGPDPVRRGIAVVAVVGGALSVTGAFAAVQTPLPRTPADVETTAVGLAASSKHSDSHSSSHKHKSKHKDKHSSDPAVLDSSTLSQSVQQTSAEGQKLANTNQAPAELANPGTSGTASMPGQLIDPHDWYLTLPTGKQGSPDTIDGSKLATYHSQFFQLNPQHNGIMFTANAGGATTVGSHYPRSELREMNGSQKADWDANSGTHTMELVQAVTQTPKTKPDVICGQIHDDKDDVMQIMLSGKQLMVRYSQNKKVMLDPNYQLGTKFKVTIQATKGHIRVAYNDKQMADLPITATKSYFKAGTYVNSNPSHGESGSAQGQVEVFKAAVAHQ